ncbi:hypothetical protein N7478_012660 [Penicillium angulare]|uniref:uncharacterized protein n=1 Tax=Penicillium angulare TaxID=116970 RepID=UPI002541828F|nr:uncharacterized protein N7478_012660 [Penicillium angulare]KAJ5256556.1 hypothetical protein N7478_012660 [Penicillium angulare]
MPPIRTQSSRNSAEKEGRILLAIQALERQEISNITVAARTFDVPRSTLRNRLTGLKARSETRPNSHKLTKFEEESLQKWIISLDDRGAAPRPSTVREAANLLLAARGTTPPLIVGEKWVYNYVKRHHELSPRFLRRYNHERAKTEDPKIIQEWFNLVQKTILENGIESDDIYNFDETGFAMGLITTAKVTTRSEYYDRRSLLQPANREWVTAIECTGASGWALPPVIIFKGEIFMKGWGDGLPRDWRFEVSPNGWTSDEIGLRWLEKMFIPLTFSRTKGKFRLLILDGHGSHLTPKFDELCSQNDIIPICIPAHLSHLLQPLDVGCSAVLNRSYGQFVESQMRLGNNHIDKFDFLEAYPSARIFAYKPETIKNSFAAAGLVPYDPNRVFSKLNIPLRTPTPPSSQGSEWELQTPSNYIQLQRQASSIKALLKKRSRNPPSPHNSAIDQILKACQIMMQYTAFLARENEELRAGMEKKKQNPPRSFNSAIDQVLKASQMIIQSTAFLAREYEELRAGIEKKKQKRTRSRQQIPREVGISAAELQDLVEPLVELPVAPAPRPARQPPPPLQPRSRALPKCGACGNEGHKRNTCPDRGR